MQDAETERQALFEEAAGWWAKLDGGASGEDQAAFRAWVARSPAHRAAFAEACALWGELDGLRRHIEPVPAVSSVSPYRDARRRASRAVRWAAAAAVLWAVLPAPAWLLADYRTAAGQSQTVRLDDGSTVTLSGASALDVDLGRGERRLRLVQGEAYFQVAPDKARPFRVGTAHGTVTALGTAFDVRVGEGFTQVAVTEHSVAVDTAGQAAVTVGEGQQLEFDTQGPGPALTADTGAITAWRRGRLVFQERPLGEVVAELNRHHAGRIWISDPAIANRQVNGVFRIDDALGALAAIETSLQLRSTRLGNYFILVHR